MFAITELTLFLIRLTFLVIIFTVYFDDMLSIVYALVRISLIL
jgi:hypothetical protein